MITPEYLEYTLDILQVHKELQESIIRDIVRRMLKHPERLTDTAEWQLEKVQQSGILYKELVRELSRATGRLESEIRAAFDDAEGRIFDYGDKTVAAAGFDPVEFKSLSPSMKQTWEAALSKTSTEAVNLTKTTAVTVQSSYIRACDLAHMQVASGAFDYNTAIRNAVKYAAGQGVTVVYPSGYVDKLDTAIRRSLLTGINQTAGQLQNMRADNLDCDIMEITAHAGARPAHAVWQGQLVSRSGRRGYLSLSDIGYGSVTGFMGANCRHNWHMFFEGISERAYTDAQLAALSSETVEYNGEKVPLWKATDYQRRLERSVKASKRELVALDEAIKNANGELKTGLQSDFEHAAQLLKKREAKLKDLCNQAGLYYDSTRCGVFSVKTENGIKSWGRSAAQKAVAANRRAEIQSGVLNKTVDKGGKSGIMGNVKNKSGVTDVHYIGKIDREIYKCVTKDIRTDEVIISETQIRHIMDRHPNDYENYFKYAETIIKCPDYILEANKPNTAFILKHIEENGKNYEMILRLQTSNDPENFKNSVITFLKVEEKRYKRYLRTKKILYKSE